MSSIQNQLAWAAGFIDADGCFSLLKNGPQVHETSKRPALSVGQKSRVPLERLVVLLGGSITKNRLSVDGTQIWQWKITRAANLVVTIDKLLPYLVLKQKQARVLRAFADQMIHRGRPLSPDVIETRRGLIEEFEIARSS